MRRASWLRCDAILIKDSCHLFLRSKSYTCSLSLLSSDSTDKPKAAKGKSSNPKAKKAAAGSSGGGGKGDTAEIIRSYLHGMHQVGINSVDEKEILLKTGYARKDSTGYRKAMKELTKELNHVEKTKGQLALTEEGHRYIAANGLKVTVIPATNEDHQEQLKETILKNAKAPEKALRAIWGILEDGKPHPGDELLEAAGYKRKDSTGYREIMKWLNKLELLEKVGTSFMFTDKVYRYGSRPN